MSVPAKWTKIFSGDQAAPDAYKAIDTFQQGMRTALSAIETAAGIATTTAELILKFYYSLDDLGAAAIQAGIDALREVLNTLEGIGAFALFVPPLSFQPYASNEKKYYIGNMPSGVPFLDTPLEDTVFLGPEGGAGNYGFYRQVVDSLNDDLDIMRPRLDSSAYVTGAAFIFGVQNNYLQLLMALKKLQGLFNIPGAVMTNNDLPDPQNVRTQIVPPPTDDATFFYITKIKSGVAGQPYALRIDWDPADKITVLTFPDGVAHRMEIQDVVLYRWLSSEMSESTAQSLARQSVKAFAGGADSAVAYTKGYNELCATFVDPDITLGAAYTYMLGYTYKDTRVSDGTVVHEWTVPFSFSTFRFVVPLEPQISPGQGVPPDWTATTLTGLVPPLRWFISWARNWLDTIEAGLKTGKDEIKDYIRFLETELRRYDRQIKDIVAVFNQIIDALSLPDIYAGVWVLPPAQGGNDYFVNQLGRALLDSSDPNRPPFDRGTEIVGGLVLYTGAETFGELKKFSDGMTLLFGNFQAAQESALNTAIDSMGAMIEQTRQQITILQNLNEGAVEEIESAGPVVGISLEPSVECTDSQHAGEESVQNVRFTGTGALTSGK